jgi:hypothetical protein
MDCSFSLWVVVGVLVLVIWVGGFGTLGFGRFGAILDLLK